MNFSIVATPIGNLEDISSRALSVLEGADVILCEDTRVTRKLLSKYDLHKETRSYHSNSSDLKLEKILHLFDEGKEVALVSDSGTPMISDPGAKLVAAVREKFGTKVKIVAIPGPSALVAALSVSGLPASDFLFLGFLPRKKGRKTLFEEMADSKRTAVFYESPHRVVKTLKELSEYVETERRIVIAREITKIYEEVIEGVACKVLQILEANSEKQKGEFVVMVEANKTKNSKPKIQKQIREQED